MRKYLEIAIIELFVILLAGVIPLILTYLDQGASGLETTLSGLVPNELIMNITMIFGFVNVAVAYLDHRILKRNVVTNIVWWYLRKIFGQVGVGVLSILRIGCGVFMSVLVLWWYQEPETLASDQKAFLLFYSCLMFVECLILSFVFQSIEALPGSRLPTKLSGSKYSF